MANERSFGKSSSFITGVCNWGVCIRRFADCLSQQNRLIVATQTHLHARPKASRRYSTSKIVILGFLFVFLGYFLLPLLWLVIASTKSYAGLFNSFGFWFAKDFNLIQNLKILFTFQNGVFL